MASADATAVTQKKLLPGYLCLRPKIKHIKVYFPTPSLPLNFHLCEEQRCTLQPGALSMSISNETGDSPESGYEVFFRSFDVEADGKDAPSLCRSLLLTSNFCILSLKELAVRCLYSLEINFGHIVCASKRSISLKLDGSIKVGQSGYCTESKC